MMSGDLTLSYKVLPAASQPCSPYLPLTEDDNPDFFQNWDKSYRSQPSTHVRFVKLLPIFYPSQWYEVGFFFKLFFPPKGPWSSCQHAGGLPFAAAAFLHGAGRTPAHPEEAKLIAKTSFPTPAACTITAPARQPPDAGKHRRQSNANIHIRPEPQPRGISYFTVTDSTLGIHRHPENDFITSSQIQIAYLNSFFKYCVSRYFYMALKSNLLKYRSCKTKYKFLSYFKLH